MQACIVNVNFFLMKSIPGNTLYWTWRTEWKLWGSGSAYVASDHMTWVMTQASVLNITEMTLALYGFIVEKLPPTPSRFHYIFNLRDLSRIYEGLTLSTPDKFKTVPQFVRLWRNECLRIFYDRLINDKDKDIVTVRASPLPIFWLTLASDSSLIWFSSLQRDLNERDLLMRKFCCRLAIIIARHRFNFPPYLLSLQTKLTDIVTDKLKELPGVAETVIKNPILFADYRNCLHSTLPRLYEDLQDFDFIKPHIENVLDDYNIVNKKMNLVMFEDALEHLTRIHRLMRLPQVHTFLMLYNP